MHRSRSKSMSKVIYLPDEVIFLALERLPVRTLLKFRCVSKSWANLIDSPEFIKSHLKFSLTDSKSQRFVFDIRLVGLSYSFTSFNFLPGNFNSLQNSDYFESPIGLYCPEPLYFQRKRLVGSSRGLVCIRYLYDEDDIRFCTFKLLPKNPQQYGEFGICLWNPWTRKYKALPGGPVEISPQGRKWIHTNYGFGYDDIHDDYKVVRLVQVPIETSQNFYNEVKVYSLKSNIWKSIENLPHNIIFRIDASGVLLNHTLHWIMRREVESFSFAEESILAIDLRTEQVQFLLLPDDFKRGVNSVLGVSDDELCVSVGDSVGFEIWIMKDYGKKDSWTKLKVDILGFNCSSDGRLVRYSESEKQLIFTDLHYNLCGYDIEKKILYKGAAYLHGNIFYTVESLVPLIGW